MQDIFALVIDGLDDLKDLENLPQDMIKAARIAVNDAATRGRTAMGKEVLNQINFPSDYVSPRNKRLYIDNKNRATNKSLEAIITAKARPTSLARFAQTTSTKGKGGVRVELKRGAVRTIPGKKAEGYSAFLMKLRAGSADLDTKANLGLAMRVPPGKRPSGAYKPKPIGNNLYLLFGPSVSQLIHGATTGRGVATDLTPDIQQMLSDEFWRQMQL